MSIISLWLRRLIVLCIATTMSYIAISAYLAVRHVPPDAPVAAYKAFRTWSPWTLPEIPTAKADTPSSTIDPEVLDARLREDLRRYPLAPEVWLARARLAIRMGKPNEKVLDLLAVGTAVKPWDPDNNWQAAMIALQVGETNVAEGYLERYLVARPQDVGKVALLAERWLEPYEVLYRIVPPEREYLERLLRDASRWSEGALAAAAWEALPETAKANRDIVAPYVEYLLRAGQSPRAVEVWRRVRTDYTSQTIANGSFTHPLAGRDPLGWRVRSTPGVNIARDTSEYYSAPASLAVTFDGEQNIHLASPTQLVPVQSRHRYRLSGYWRAEGLTTRSLPFLRVRQYPRGRMLGKVPAPALEDWPWQSFSLTFQVPAETVVVAVTLRRHRTDAFDRFIAGTLHLDDLVLEPLPEEPAFTAQRHGSSTSP